jgi:hypothetical protein
LQQCEQSAHDSCNQNELTKSLETPTREQGIRTEDKMWIPHRAPAVGPPSSPKFNTEPDEETAQDTQIDKNLKPWPKCDVSIERDA